MYQALADFFRFRSYADEITRNCILGLLLHFSSKLLSASFDEREMSSVFLKAIREAKPNFPLKYFVHRSSFH